MLNIIIIGEDPKISAQLYNIVMEGFPGARVGEYNFQLLETHTIKESPDLLLLAVDSSVSPEDFIDSAVKFMQPEHIVLYTDEAHLIDPALYFEDTLVKGVAYKNQTDDLLLATLRVVILGGFCFPPYDRRLSKHQKPRSKKASKAAQHFSQSFSRRINRTENKITENLCEATLLGLTERQYEVLVLLAQGWPLKTIAKKMKIATATAKTHTEALYQRLGANNRGSAVFAAMERGAKLGIQLERSEASERS